MKKCMFFAVAFVASFIMAGHADACTRVVYKGDSSIVVVGRSLDWRNPIPTNIWVYPRGMKKVSYPTGNRIEWVSKYGAVYAVGYDAGITEGMNEKGLVVNGLFCKTARYETTDSAETPTMSLAVFPAWLLDRCATTPEAVEALRSTSFHFSARAFDGGTVSRLHWGITDAAGCTAVVEVDSGHVTVYEADSLRVLTNDPTLPAMQAVDNYWKSVGGVNMLPGGVRSTDRFVRAEFFVGHVGRVADGDSAVAVTRSIMANVSVPMLYEPLGEPNVSATQWRTYSDLKRLRYYFDRVESTGLFYVDLGALPLGKGQPVLRLDTSRLPAMVGSANALLLPCAPFEPMY